MKQNSDEGGAAATLVSDYHGLFLFVCLPFHQCFIGRIPQLSQVWEPSVPGDLLSDQLRKHHLDVLSLGSR